MCPDWQTELFDKVLSFPVDLGLELVVGTRAMVQMTKKLFWLRQSLGPPSPNTIRSQYVQIDKLGGRASNRTCTRNIVCSDSVSHLAYAKIEVHFRRHPAGQTSDLRSCHPCRACPSVLEDMSRREGPCNDHRFTSDPPSDLVTPKVDSRVGTATGSILPLNSPFPNSFIANSIAKWDC